MDISKNIHMWESYHWAEGGDEWSQHWGDSNLMWWSILFPRIREFLPRPTILEIAPGFGRWTNFLRRFCDHYVGVDLVADCVEACQRKFPDLEFYQNDGSSLPMIKDRSVDFCFSYDSLVHADSNVMRGYTKELARVLTDDGAAFLHHSNLGEYKDILTRRGTLAKFVPSWKIRNIFRLNTWGNERDPDVTAAFIRERCSAEGLYCRQELITWLSSDDLMIDALTVVTRRPTDHALLKNPDFAQLASQMKQVHQHYGSKERTAARSS